MLEQVGPRARPARDIVLREQLATTVARNLLTFALGRELEYYDMPAVRKIVHDAARRDYRMQSIVLGIVNSQPFQMRRAPDAGPAAGTSVAQGQ